MEADGVTDTDIADAIVGVCVEEDEGSAEVDVDICDEDDDDMETGMEEANEEAEAVVEEKLEDVGTEIDEEVEAGDGSQILDVGDGKGIEVGLDVP